MGFSVIKHLFINIFTGFYQVHFFIFSTFRMSYKNRGRELIEVHETTVEKHCQL